jgi:glycosyltransferase involved in cell wall biosynthesis
MTISLQYTAIVPRVDRTGPCNVAVDLCEQAAAAGYTVLLLYLSGSVVRDDVTKFETRRFRWTDVWRLKGVIHTHCLRPDVLGTLFTVRRNCFVLTTLHNYFLVDIGFDHPAWQTRLSYEVWSRCIARFGARVAISKAMARYYRRLMPSSVFDVAYNFRGERRIPDGAVPPDVRAFVDENRASGRVVMAFVGTLSKRKNVVRLAEKVAATERMALVMCGTGPLAGEVAVIANRNDGRILLAGYLPCPAAVVGQCDLLVLPSFAEGLPLVVIESLMHARPALMSNIAVHRELQRLGAGRTFDHRRFSNLEAEAMRLVEEAAHAPAAVREVYRTHFAPEPGFRRYVEIVDQRFAAKPCASK